MSVETNFPALMKRMKWRYLDSFDSTRYSPTEFVNIGAPLKLREEQARIETATTILMGNGIIVPNNQLIDSVGFLRVASEIIAVASRYLSDSKSVFVPIKYANFHYPSDPKGGERLRNPFLLAAFLFAKDGKEDPKNYFELSAWSDLDNRSKWAQVLEEQTAAIPSDLTKNQPHLEQRAGDLIRVLNFFTRNQDLVEKAEGTAGIREAMTLSIATLTKEKIESDDFFINVLTRKGGDTYNKRLSKILNTVNVFSKLKENKILDNRSKIREELITKKDQYFENIEGSVESVRIGVLKTFNSIYNFSSYKSTKAQQDNQTEPMEIDNIWGDDEAAFALGQWARETYEESQKGIKSTLDISSNQNALINPNVSDFAGSSNEFWGNFFDFERSESWDTSLNNYINSLIGFEIVKKQYDNLSREDKTASIETDLKDKKEQYENARQKHIANINSFLPPNYKILIENEEKAVLMCSDKDGKLLSKIQIENFAEYATLTKQEKGSLNAMEVAKEITTKGRTAEYGE